MNWPSLHEYTKAISNPGKAFVDQDLAAAMVDCDLNGQPISVIGNFASIFKLKKPDRNYAVKCFLAGMDDQSRRYIEIQKHFARNSTENTIAFEYLTNGIQVNGAWHPIVKMDWLDGETLDTFVLNNIHQPAIIQWVFEQFKLLCTRLHKAQIAHGDLHHGNLIVTKRGLRLVDYDGAYVPALSGMEANELGHHNYQHPRRVAKDFGPHLDNFSAWVIHTSLQALTIDPSLWQALAGGDECLLFRSSDFGNPLNSYAFSVLEGHSSQELRFAARTLRTLCDVAPDAVPPIGESLKRSAPLPPLRSSITLPTWIPRQDTSKQTEREPLRVFPNFRYFNDAMRFPLQHFEDTELKQARCLPEDTKVGAHGRVYHFRSEYRDLAIKVFSADSPQRDKRYEEIKKADKGSAKRFFVDFEYLARGVYINGEWYPVLKMPWVYGQTISELSAQYVTEPLTSFIADQFLALVCAMRTAGIAHGDLEFGNLIFDRYQHELKVIDYDNMFVPALTRLGSAELGHPGYQSPRRTYGDYGPFVDNFSAWLVHYMLKYLFVNGQLYEMVDTCLNEERQGSTQHATLRNLENAREDEVRYLGKMLRLLLERPLHLIPDLHPDEALETLISKQSKEVTAGGGLLKRKKPF